MIEVEQIGKYYGSLEAVKGVSFSVETGEVVGLLGPNGAGKTTIMKILTCYFYPNRGTARLNGFDIFEQPLTVKASVGYLPEDTPLYPELNVMEYLDFIAESHSCSGAEKKRRIEGVIEECGLNGVVYRPIGQLSKGYRQRTGLAQSILHNPEILILDEPTTGLDPNQIFEIRELIKRLGREKTVILSTHIMQEVEATCGRVMILNDGRIVAQGTTEEIWHEMKGETLLYLTLKGKDGSEDRPARVLGKIPGVRKIIRWSSLAAERLEVQLSLDREAEAGGRVEERIFDWAVENGYKILSMVPQRLSLEDIFRKLTLEETGNDN